MEASQKSLFRSKLVLFYARKLMSRGSFRTYIKVSPGYFVPLPKQQWIQIGSELDSENNIFQQY